jgi:hypothetical protein
MRTLTMMTLALAIAALGVSGCSGDAPSREPLPSSRVTTDLTHLKDGLGRYVYLHGVNLSGSTKTPKIVDGKTLTPLDLRLANNKGVPSYVGKNWSVEGCTFDAAGAFQPASEATCEAAGEILKLRNVGFNVFRFLLNWEGIEHEGRGKYDEAYLASIAKQVKIAEHYGVYILMDMHQDAYSRHLVTLYNEKPSYTADDGTTVVYPARGTIENMVLSLVPPFTDAVRGEGAPRWVVEACLFEKNLDADTWGIPRLTSGMADANLSSIIDLLGKVLPAGEPGGPLVPAWVNELLGKIPSPSVPVTDTSDLLPFTNWSLMAATSIDVARNFACLLAGEFAADDPYKRKGAFKGHTVEGVPVTTYLQGAYAGAWREVVKSMKAQNGGKVPTNVIGYDIINEPIGNFAVMSATSAIFTTGLYESAQETLVGLLGKETGGQIFDLLTALRLLPVLPQKPVKPEAPAAIAAEPTAPGAGATEEEKGLYFAAKYAWDQAKAAYDKQMTAYDLAAAAYPDLQKAFDDEVTKTQHDWGFQYTDLFSVVGLNLGFDRAYMTPFYEVVGREIFEEDPEAVIWFEHSMNVEVLLGSGGGMFDQGMLKPRICRCEDEGTAQAGKAIACEDTTCKAVREADTVYAPHYYADIYPMVGFNQPSRQFTVEEVRYRDYDAAMLKNLDIVKWNLENVPAVYGEFGTYYNFGGIEQSFKDDYLVSSHILDNYYETLERMFMHQMLWCYTPDNDPRYGDWWNKEDFSIWQGWKDSDLTIDRDIGLANPVVTTTAKAIADGRFRSDVAWSRPYPRFLAGKPVSMHFYSPLHYFDPDKGEVPPEREFEVVYEAKETAAPTEIFVPAVQYPDSEGFYVWLSDGYASWDPASRVLYHHPVNDDPGARHFVRLLPPIDGRPATGWQYFIKGDQIISHD